VALASPVYTGYLALDGVYSVGQGSHHYWLSLGIVHGLCWSFMGATLILTPRVWRESPHERPSAHRWLWRFGYTAGWRRAFSERLDINPVFALAARLRWPYLVFWGLVALVAINVLWLTLGHSGNPGERRFHQYFSNALVLTNRVWITAIACRFFLELRRTGGLELILTTPVGVPELLQGHWRALRRLFIWPVLAISALHVFFVWMSWRAAGSSYAGSHPSIGLYALDPAGSLAKFLTDIMALCWVGAWLSVSSRKPGLAILKTYSLVILLPWAFVYFAPESITYLNRRLASFTISHRALERMVFTLTRSPNLLPSVCWVLKNCILVLWAGLHLQRHFRQAAAQTHAPHPWAPHWRRRLGFDPVPEAPLLAGDSTKTLVL